MAKEHEKHLLCLRKIISSVKDRKRKRHDHDHQQKRRKLWGGLHKSGSSSPVSSNSSKETAKGAAKRSSTCLEDPSPVPPESAKSQPDDGDNQAEYSEVEEPVIKEPFPGLAKVPRLLTNCSQNHDNSSAEYPGCQKPHGPYIEITLIDCEYRQLITTQSSIPYAALSYVWGPNTKPVPLSEEGKLAERVSRSIEDAMMVTQYLGMRYIWVDQYCVDQENEKIKKRQIDEMHEVYRHAELTIIAAVGGDAEAGLAPLCPPSEAGTAWCDIDTNDASSFSSAETEAKDKRLASALETIAGSAWNTRGWTYQESYVSRRVLVFHAGGTYYECSALAPYYREQTEVSETLQASDGFWTDRSLANGPTQRGFATGPHTELLSWLAVDPIADLDEWRDVDERWCIGIVQGLPFNYMPGEEKVMGWEVKNAKLNTSGLCWYHDTEGTRRRQGYPSWSWIGWHGPVSWNLPYGYADYGDTTAFQLEVAGFRTTLGKKRIDLDQARKASGPLVLCLASVAIPAKAFATKKGDNQKPANDTLYMYGCAMPWSADESITNANDTRLKIKGSYLSRADGARQVSRRALREGLQEGIFKLMLVHVYQNSHEQPIRCQAWILRKLSNDKGKLYYERIGGVNHSVSKDERVTEEEQETFQDSLCNLVKSSELEMFNIF